nr:amino-acid permease bat1 [Quercus suber]
MSDTMEEKHANSIPSELLDAGRKDNVAEGETLEAILGYKPELQRNRSLWTLLFQSLAIAAIPYGEGAPLMSAIIGGGQLSIFLGWIVVLILDECVAVSLGELASRYPTSGGPSYWAFQVAPKGRTVLAYITGWIFMIGNWTITLSGEYRFGMVTERGIRGLF